MSEAAIGRFSCDACGRSYTWRPELSGRKVRCVCGQFMIAPESAPQPSEELYALADGPPGRPRDMRPEPRMPATADEGTLKRPIPQRTERLGYQRPAGPGSSTVLDRYFPDRVKDLYLPLVLIAAGTAIEFARAALAAASIESAVEDIAYTGVGLILHTLLMLFAIFITAKLRDISFGPFWTAILKLCAISIAPGAVTTLLAAVLSIIPLFGGLIAWVAGFVLYFALIGAMFDLDESDTWCCVFVVFLVKLAAVFIIAGMIMRGMI